MTRQAGPFQPFRARVTGTRHMCAAGHYLAATTGFQILEAGGNAIDAGVGAGITLGVVESMMVGFAGVAPIIIYLADKQKVVTVSGVGTWPKAASWEYFQKHHGGRIPPGIMQSVVPAAADAWITCLEEFGTLSFREVAAPAIRLAREGFPMYALMSKLIEGQAEAYRAWQPSADVYLPGGKVPQPGERFVQEDLGRTIQYLADEEAAHASKGRKAGLQAARDAFYKGDVAAKIAAFHKENGGWLTREDMAGFRVAVEPPVHVRFHGVDVYGGGPWGQGPAMLMALNILEGIDLRAMGHNSQAYIHACVEALKLANADREAYLGDPEFVNVPMAALMNKQFAAARRNEIRLDRAWPEMPPAGKVSGTRWPTAEDLLAGTRTGVAPAAFAEDTSHTSVVDRHGNVFAATPSEGNGGGGRLIPGLGFVPNRRGKGSWADPGKPGCLGPGRRPRMTNGPAIAIRDGRHFMPFGTPGSDNQTQAMMQVFLNAFVFDMHPQAAVEAARFATHSFPGTFEPHAYEPASLYLESRITEEAGAALAAMGHKVTWWNDWGPPAGHSDIATMCAIASDRQTGMIEGGADPRRPSAVIGW